MDDPVTAGVLAERAEDKVTALSMAGFDPIRSLLTAVLDAVNNQTAVLVALNSTDGKLPQISAAPRPRTEVDRARERLREQSRRALVAMALGHNIDDI